MKLAVKSEPNLAKVSQLLSQADLVPIGLENDQLHLFCELAEEEQLIGVIGVEVYGSACLLRSLAVREDRRNAGIARMLLKEALAFAQQSQCFDVYIITETIGDTMLRYGFTNITRKDVPQEILQSPFFNGICPCTSQVMYKNIKEGEGHVYRVR